MSFGKNTTSLSSSSTSSRPVAVQMPFKRKPAQVCIHFIGQGPRSLGCQGRSGQGCEVVCSNSSPLFYYPSCQIHRHSLVFPPTPSAAEDQIHLRRQVMVEAELAMPPPPVGHNGLCQLTSIRRDCRTGRQCKAICWRSTLRSAPLPDQRQNRA